MAWKPPFVQNFLTLFLIFFGKFFCPNSFDLIFWSMICFHRFLNLSNLGYFWISLYTNKGLKIGHEKGWMSSSKQREGEQGFERSFVRRREWGMRDNIQMQMPMLMLMPSSILMAELKPAWMAARGQKIDPILLLSSPSSWLSSVCRVNAYTPRLFLNGAQIQLRERESGSQIRFARFSIHSTEPVTQKQYASCVKRPPGGAREQTSHKMLIVVEVSLNILGPPSRLKVALLKRASSRPLPGLSKPLCHTPLELSSLCMNYWWGGEPRS